LINWPNSLFLMGTLLLTLTAVPAYIWRNGLEWFQVGLFFIFFITTGLSITLGYHRLFSHLTFKARWPVRLFTLLFGAAAFENSVLCWAATIGATIDSSITTMIPTTSRRGFSMPISAGCFSNRSRRPPLKG